MKSKIILIAALLLGSCNKPLDNAQIPDVPAKSIPAVHFAFETPAPETRALNQDQEKTLSDINLYIICPNGDILHRYQAASRSDITINLNPGEYELYAIGNAGKDLGPLDASGMETLSFGISSQADLQRNSKLLMRARETFSVLGTTSVPVQMERCVAKYTLHISVADAFSSFTLRSFQVVNVPRTLQPFTSVSPQSSAGVTAYPKTDLSGQSYATEFYLPENKQGIVPGIDNPRQRNRQQAPAQATYLHIEGEADGQKADYYIFLGENMLGDFNVLRNRHYRLEITISGMNNADTRLTTVSFTLSPLKNRHFANEKAVSNLVVTGTDPTGIYTLRWNQNSGNGTIALDRENLAQNTATTLMNGNGTKEARVTYVQSVAGEASMTFTLSDIYGYAITQNLSTTYIVLNHIDASFIDPPAATTVGTPGQITLSLYEEDYSGPFYVKFQYKNQDMVYSVNTTQVSDGESVKMTSGLNKITFIPSKAGTEMLRVSILDDYGQEIILDTSFPVSEPVFNATITPPVSPVTYTQNPMSLTFSEENYSEDFNVTYTAPGQNCCLYYNGKQLSQDTPLTVKAGTQSFGFYSVYAETIPVTFIITDRCGRTKTISTNVVCKPLPLTVSFRTKIQNINKTISEGGCTGYQADPTMLIVTATIDKSLPYDLVFSLDAAYSLGYYTGISTHPETFANNDFNLQINSSESLTTYTIASYTGYCMGTSTTGGYRKLLRQGYYFATVYDRSTGTSHCPVTITVKNATGIPAGTVEYNYVTIND